MAGRVRQYTPHARDHPADPARAIEPVDRRSECRHRRRGRPRRVGRARHRARRSARLAARRRRHLRRAHDGPARSPDRGRRRCRPRGLDAPRNSTRCVTQASTSSRSSYRKGRSSTTSRRRTGRRQVSMAAGVPVRPVACPRSWLASRSWSLVPVADEVPDDWVDVIPDGRDGRRRLAGHAPADGPGRRRPADRAERAGASCGAPTWSGLSHLDVARDTSLGDLVAVPPSRRPAARDPGRPRRPARDDR